MTPFFGGTAPLRVKYYYLIVAFINCNFLYRINKKEKLKTIAYLTVLNIKYEGVCIFNQAFYMTAYQPAWPWRRGPACTSLTSLSAAQYGCSVSAAVTIPTHCTRKKKNTALQRVRFSHFFLRIRPRENRCRVDRRVPGYRLTLCCRTATKTGKG